MTEANSPRPPLLLTRPRAGSERFAAQFRARFGADWPVLISPLTETRPTGAEVPAAEALIFTSEQAVAPVIAAGPAAGRRAYCVGARTAQVARAAGFEVIEGPGEARGLAALILAQHRGGRLLHARGREVVAPLADWLNSAGTETVEAVVYAQEALPLSDAARDLLVRAPVVLAPVFSPRSGQLLAQAVSGARAALWLAPISAAAAEGCADIAARIEVAPTPDAAGVLSALARLLGAETAGADKAG